MEANKILPIFSEFLYLVQMKFGTEGTHKNSPSDSDSEKTCMIRGCP